MKRDMEFQRELQNRLLAECNMAPDLTAVDPVSFLTEWQQRVGLGGYLAGLYDRVKAQRSKNGVSLQPEQAAAEILRLALREAAKPQDRPALPVRLEAMLRYRRMAEPLVDWFHDNARILRWRSEPRPYYVWVSEIMLQQTRVEAVKEYFDRFIAALPDIRALAECQEEELLKLWEGLGYYNRARNLQKAAKRVAEEYGGELPDSYEELQKLPGIGSYTAGAISSIAYGKPAPAVDGNVLRVTKRLMGSRDDITKPAVKKEMEQMILAVSKDAQKKGIYPGDLSQAMMELGAVVCLPAGKPLCDKCPVESLCRAAGEESWREIPVKPPKKERRIEERTVFVIRQQERTGVRKRPGKGLLAGLWELPNVEGRLSEREAKELLQDNLQAEILEIIPLEEAKHIFSHIEWHMKGYSVRIGSLQDRKEDVVQGAFAGLHMATEQEMKEKYSLPSAFEAYRPEKGAAAGRLYNV